ncbi:hypothetical protein Tco_0684804 [Tanacetum coccineum]
MMEICPLVCEEKLALHFATMVGRLVVMVEIDPYLGRASLKCVCSHGMLALSALAVAVMNMSSFDADPELLSWRRHQNSLLTPSGFHMDGVTTMCDGVTVADKEKPLEDSTG